MKISFLLILGIIISFSIAFAPAFATSLNPADPNIIPWNCPPRPTDTPPTAETGFGSIGDRLYLRVYDQKGNDLEIWCKEGLSSVRYWEVEISFPNGDHSILSLCEYGQGGNKWKLDYTGEKSDVPTMSGTKLIHINGTLDFFKHDNEDFWDDHHTTYNFTSGEAVKIVTKKHYKGEIETEEVIKTIKKKLDASDPPSSVFAWNDNTELPDSDRTCSMEPQDETEAVSAYYLPGEGKSHILYYPQMTGVDEITLDEDSKSLEIIFAEKFVQDRYFSISIPRDLLDVSGKDSFAVLDGSKQIPYEETITDTHRTFNFDLAPTSHQISIEGTELFKELPPQADDVFDLVPPKKQANSGVMPGKILCNEGLEIILKPGLESSACVKPQTAEKLVERGWSVSG